MLVVLVTSCLVQFMASCFSSSNDLWFIVNSGYLKSKVKPCNRRVHCSQVSHKDMHCYYHKALVLPTFVLKLGLSM